MYHTRHQIKLTYPMTTPTNSTTGVKSRGHSLFDRQAQLHASETNSSPDTDHPTIQHVIRREHLTRSHSSTSPKTFKPKPSTLSMVCPMPSVPLEAHAVDSVDENVQLISVHPRPELDYIKPISPTSSHEILTTTSEELIETDFPVIENSHNEHISTTNDSLTSETAYANVVEKAFDYLNGEIYDEEDDDNDVVHGNGDDFNGANDQYDSCPEDDVVNDNESLESNDLLGTSTHRSQTLDSGVHTGSSCGGHERLTDQPSNMALSSRETNSEDYDSDFDNSSHEDDEQSNQQDVLSETEQQEQRNTILRQQTQVLHGMIQEWLKKEQSYCRQLERLRDALHPIQNARDIIDRLLSSHKMVCELLNELADGEFELSQSLEKVASIVEKLASTLVPYHNYIKISIASMKKTLEKRWMNKDWPIDDALSTPNKQFMQIILQIQDLYQAAQSFEIEDRKYMEALYHYAQMSKSFREENGEEINKIILKTEDVATVVERGLRDHCRLILYSDAVVCAIWKAKLLTSPKYYLRWFILISDLQWFIPEEQTTEDSCDTGDNVKTNLKSAYKEWERNGKTNNAVSSRISKAIKKHESEYNLAQSKLPLHLIDASKRGRPHETILFSSNYQRQEWIDLIDKTKVSFTQQVPSVHQQKVNDQTNQIRLSESVIQKRLDLVKQTTYDVMSEDFSTACRTSPQNTQTRTNSKTYSGTLEITIHKIQGIALSNPLRQTQTGFAIQPTSKASKNYQYFIAVEIDSYNTFYPYAKTATETINHNSVEFKGEVFQVELEHSSAFRLLVHRIDMSSAAHVNSLDRVSCIGKFHRDIETGLKECGESSDMRTIILESQSRDLNVKISLKYFQRDGTFKRQLSKRAQAVFGRRIEQLISNPSRLVNGIPRIIVRCIEMVDRDGLKETGIYRVCCVTSDLQKLRQIFDRDCTQGEKFLAEKNVHVAANLLKMFFRQLPEPIFTSTLYKNFINAIKLSDMDYRRVTLLTHFSNLPESHKRILFYLFDHLIRVSENSSSNMMHLDNLAVVFGPTLMRPSNSLAQNQGLTPMQTDLDHMSSELQDSMHQCQIVLACFKLRQEGFLK